MKKIYISFILLILFWLLLIYYLQDVLLASYIFAIDSIIYLVFPLIYVLSKKTREDKVIKKLSFWNSVAVVGLSFVYSHKDNIDTTTLLSEIFGSLLLGAIYYFVNYCLYSPDKISKQKSNKNETNKNQYTSVCSNCGTKVKDSDKKCPKCGEVFDDDIDEDSEEKAAKTDMEQKYSDLNKLKRLLDKDIITKKEFEEEKKKILNK